MKLTQGIRNVNDYDKFKERVAKKYDSKVVGHHQEEGIGVLELANGDEVKYWDEKKLIGNPFHHKKGSGSHSHGVGVSMTSQIYPTYSRIINVYRQSAVDGTLTLADDIGVGGNISVGTISASFTLCAERGCCEGEIVTLASPVDRLFVRRTQPFGLEHGFVIQMLPEAGADPWYTGYIRQRSRDF